MIKENSCCKKTYVNRISIYTTFHFQLDLRLFHNDQPQWLFITHTNDLFINGSHNKLMICHRERFITVINVKVTPISGYMNVAMENWK